MNLKKTDEKPPKRKRNEEFACIWAWPATKKRLKIKAAKSGVTLVEYLDKFSKE